MRIAVNRAIDTNEALGHQHFLVSENQADAYLVFICLADASDLPSPATFEQREGARRLTQRCLV